MHGGRVVADGVLTREVQPRFDVLPQADGCGQQVVVIACNNRPSTSDGCGQQTVNYQMGVDSRS